MTHIISEAHTNDGLALVAECDACKSIVDNKTIIAMAYSKRLVAGLTTRDYRDHNAVARTVMVNDESMLNAVAHVLRKCAVAHA